MIGDFEPRISLSIKASERITQKLVIAMDFSLSFTYFTALEP
jgi:hypothetical protein